MSQLPQYQYDHWYAVGEEDFRTTGFSGRYLQMKRISKGDHRSQEPSIPIACAYMDGFTAAFDRSRG
jgi:hypothetical protein